MNTQEAQEEAVKRLGNNGYAEIIGSEKTCVIGTHDGKIHGYGASFEDAFKMLDLARATGASPR